MVMVTAPVRPGDTDTSPVYLMPASPDRPLKGDDAAALVKVEPSAPVLVVSGLAEDEKHAQVNGQLWFPALVYRLGGDEGTDNLLLSFKTDCDCRELPIDVGMNGRDFFSASLFCCSTFLDFASLAQPLTAPAMPLAKGPSRVTELLNPPGLAKGPSRATGSQYPPLEKGPSRETGSSHPPHILFMCWSIG